MPGFSSFDAIIDATSVQGKAQDREWNKVSMTTVANSPWSLWAVAGQPGAGGFGGTPLAARAVTGATTGALRFTNPTGPDTLHALALDALSSVALAGTLFLLDRLLDYPGIDCTSTALQSMDNTATIPRYTTGLGVYMFCEVTTTLGSTPQTMTITYTNSGGTGSRTATLAPTPSAATGRIPQTGFFIPLQAGDHAGMRSVESAQFGGSMGAGVLNLTLCRPYFKLPLKDAGISVERNLVLHTPRMQQIIDDAALMFILMAGGANSGDMSGGLRAAAR